jgi:membrane-associated phospholipid phosphatase
LSNVVFVQLGVGVIGFNALAASQAQPDGGFLAWRDFLTDSAVVAEATVLAADFNQAAKFLVARERPFVHALNSADKATTLAPADNNTPFYSGHASTSMALAVSMAEVASLRKYEWAPVAWVTLPALSLFTGYLRIAADKHYFTDVTTGAAMGALFGYFVPHFFHSPRDSSILNKAGIASFRPMIATSSNETLVGAVGSFQKPGREHCDL